MAFLVKRRPLARVFGKEHPPGGSGQRTPNPSLQNALPLTLFASGSRDRQSACDKGAPEHGLIATGPSVGAQPIRSPMKTESLPETVQAIIAQAGGLGLRGAFVYIGAQNFTYRCAKHRRPVRRHAPARAGPAHRGGSPPGCRRVKTHRGRPVAASAASWIRARPRGLHPPTDSGHPRIRDRRLPRLIVDLRFKPPVLQPT